MREGKIKDAGKMHGKLDDGILGKAEFRFRQTVFRTLRKIDEGEVEVEVEMEIEVREAEGKEVESCLVYL